MGVRVLPARQGHPDAPNRPVPVLWGSPDGLAADPARAGQAMPLRRVDRGRRQGHPAAGIRGMTAPHGLRTIRMIRWTGAVPPAPFLLVNWSPAARTMWLVERVDLPPRRATTTAVMLMRCRAVRLPLPDGEEAFYAGYARAWFTQGKPRPPGVPGRAG